MNERGRPCESEGAGFFAAMDPLEPRLLLSIEGLVWADANDNGIQDPGEDPIAGIEVSLFDELGTFVGSAVSDAQGLYSLADPADGWYYLVLDPGHYMVSMVYQGEDAALNSDFDPVFLNTDFFDIPAAGGVVDMDAGLVADCNIEGIVWEDHDGDGIQDPLEHGLDGLEVNLYDDQGTLLETSVTADGGQYIFQVAGGTYQVGVTPLAGYVVSPANQGANEEDDCDADATGRTPVFTWDGVDASVEHTDIGLTPGFRIGDHVWNDHNNDGIHDEATEGHLADVVINLRDQANTLIATTTSSLDGEYEFIIAAAGDYIVEFVTPPGHEPTLAFQGGDPTVDSNIDAAGRANVTVAAGTDLTIDAGFVETTVAQGNLGGYVWEDLNTDGIQDPGEPGILDVDLRLYTAGGVLVASTVTGPGGMYAFADPADGDYYIQISPFDQISPIHQGADPTLDSDFDAFTANTAVFTFTNGGPAVEMDAGLWSMVQVGRQVWFDQNGDGIQDAGEPGVAGVTVNLLHPDGMLAVSTVTNVDGRYKIDALGMHAYVVEFILPDGYAFTLKNQGADWSMDSDVNPLTGRTDPFMFMMNDAMLGRLDAGLALADAAVGGTVWDDVNANGVQDAGEAPKAGRIVYCRNAGNQILGWAFTDAAGAYQFNNLKPGDYIIEVPGGADSEYGQGGVSLVDPTTHMSAPVAAGSGQITSVGAGVTDLQKIVLGGAARTLKYTDAAGQEVRINLSGGLAEIKFRGSGVQAQQAGGTITVTGQQLTLKKIDLSPIASVVSLYASGPVSGKLKVRNSYPNASLSLQGTAADLEIDGDLVVRLI